VALAALLPVTAVLAAVHLGERTREREALQLAEEAAAIARWRSPTEMLLASSYVELMRDVPSLHASVLDPEPQPGGPR
jgi:hypothetical protein